MVGICVHFHVVRRIAVLLKPRGVQFIFPSSGQYEKTLARRRTVLAGTGLREIGGADCHRFFASDRQVRLPAAVAAR